LFDIKKQIKSIIAIPKKPTNLSKISSRFPYKMAFIKASKRFLPYYSPNRLIFARKLFLKYNTEGKPCRKEFSGQ